MSITRERLLEIIVTGPEASGAEQNELARMALAAMDSEPVAIIDQANLDYLRSGADADVWPPEREEMGDVLLYRHAQPAPDLNSVSINDNHPLPNPPAENGIPKTAYCGEGLCLSEPITPDTIEGVLPSEMIARGNKIVNPRSAGLYLNDILHPAPVVPMENHIGSKNSLDAIVSFIKSKSNPTVKCYEEVSGQLFKDNCHGIHSHVIEYILKLGEELEDLRAEQAEMQPAPVVPDEMTIRGACKFVQDMRLFDDVSVIVMRTWNACRAAMLAAAPQSPGGDHATVPGKWIPVSEQMPDDEQEVLTINRMGHCFVSFFDKHSGLFFDRLDAPAACCIEHVLVTHWMPLPAAPKEVK